MRVIGLAAISLDGCITRHDGQGSGFASEADRRFFRAALASFDCSLMGSATYEVQRAAILASPGSGRLRVVLSSRPEAYRSDERPGRLEFKNRAAAAALDELAARGLRRCAVLGGTRVYTDCLRSGRMHELWLTLEPAGFGAGKRLFEASVDFRFKLLAVEPISADTLVLKYRSAGT